MHFEPTQAKLIPDMSPREEFVVLARCLFREGYNDHLAGHITCNLGDGTLLCNPWLITWDELRPHQLIRIDLEGNLVEGDWPVPPGIPLHLALHAARPGVASTSTAAPWAPWWLPRMQLPASVMPIWPSWPVTGCSSSAPAPGQSTREQLPLSSAASTHGT